MFFASHIYDLEGTFKAKIATDTRDNFSPSYDSWIQLECHMLTSDALVDVITKLRFTEFQFHRRLEKPSFEVATTTWTIFLPAVILNFDLWPWPYVRGWRHIDLLPSDCLQPSRTGSACSEHVHTARTELNSSAGRSSQRVQFSSTPAMWTIEPKIILWWSIKWERRATLILVALPVPF